jgi:hypothetical protein
MAKPDDATPATLTRADASRERFRQAQPSRRRLPVPGPLAGSPPKPKRRGSLPSSTPGAVGSLSVSSPTMCRLKGTTAANCPSALLRDKPGVVNRPAGARHVVTSQHWTSASPAHHPLADLTLNGPAFAPANTPHDLANDRWRNAMALGEVGDRLLRILPMPWKALPQPPSYAAPLRFPLGGDAKRSR